MTYTGDLLHRAVVPTSVSTSAAAAADNDDDDASQCDVIATHPEHLLLSSMDSCPATRFWKATE